MAKHALDIFCPGDTWQLQKKRINSTFNKGCPLVQRPSHTVSEKERRDYKTEQVTLCTD